MSSRICWQSMALRYASSDGTRLPGTCTRLGAKGPKSISNRKFALTVTSTMLPDFFLLTIGTMYQKLVAPFYWQKGCETARNRAFQQQSTAKKETARLGVGLQH